jgi:hypothetical protein
MAKEERGREHEEGGREHERGAPHMQGSGVWGQCKGDVEV